MWIYIGIFIFLYFAIENLKSLDCWTDSYVGETKRTTSQLQAHSLNVPVQSDRAPSLCIAAREATGEQARRKILPALFALYYSGFLPEAVPQFLYVVRPLCLLPRIATESSFFTKPVVFIVPVTMYLLFWIINPILLVYASKRIRLASNVRRKSGMFQ